MATLKICINKQRYRHDGANAVYIRVLHHGKAAYIKTDKIVSAKGLTKELEVKDPFVLQQLSATVVNFMGKLNRVDISGWSVNDVAEYLRRSEEDVCFSTYARRHVDKLLDNGQKRNAKNYSLALSSMELFFGTNQIMFSQLTSHNVNCWIDSLSKTARAKEMYPICIRQVFRAAVNELNDYDNEIIRIKTNPWPKVKIPAADKPDKKAISAEACREFFAAPLPASRLIEPLAELGRDVAMLVLCLAGINTCDLYNLKKSDYYGGIIHYKRAKTMRSRADNAYIEMRVPDAVKSLFVKYRDDSDSDKLFRFAQRYCDIDSFCANVNNGIRQVCKSMGMRKDDYYSAYTFRHTWATTAQNDCGASLSEVGFAMNHSQRNTKVTRGYVDIDFSPAWDLNDKVVEFILFSDMPSKSMLRQQSEQSSVFRLSRKSLVRAQAFYKGRRIAEVEDIGIGNLDQATDMLVAQFPDDLPKGAIVQFRIENLDNGKTTFYEHQKGKGF